MTQTAYAELGYELLQARQRSGVAIDHYARSLHIRAKYLYALEQGDLSQLPGVAYARGYLLRYAAALGMEVAEVAVRFDAAGEVRRGFFVPQAATADTRPQRALMMGCAVLALVLMLWQWSDRSSPADAVEPPPFELSSEAAPKLEPAAGPCLLNEDTLECVQRPVSVAAPFYPVQPVQSVLELGAFYREGGGQ